ncbi:MAG: type II secretion system protein [Gemmatimonadota bacterium]
MSRRGRGARCSERGFTLIEVIVVTAILSIAFSVAGLALSSGLGRAEDARASIGDAAFREAALRGEAVVAYSDSAHRDTPVLFLPDGRIVGDATARWLDSVGRR